MIKNIILEPGRHIEFDDQLKDKFGEGEFVVARIIGSGVVVPGKIENGVTKLFDTGMVAWVLPGEMSEAGKGNEPALSNIWIKPSEQKKSKLG